MLDVSRSMEGLCEGRHPKIEILKRSIIPVLGTLCRKRDGTRIELGAFAHKAKMIADAPADESGHPRLVEAVKALQPKGGTDIEYALRTAATCFDPEQFGLKQVTLLSDGCHMESSDPRAAADILRQRGVFIATIGFGDDADENMLRALASPQGTGSAYWHARDQKTLSHSLAEASRTLTY